MVTRLILLLFILVGCQQKKEVKQLISINDISYESIQENFDCGKTAEESFGLTESLGNSFIKKIQKKYDGGSFERIILIFYTIEGEVMQYYEGSLLVSSNGTVKGVIKNTSTNTTISKEIQSFNVDNFYEYISSIKEYTRVNSSRFFVIDIDSKKTVCTYSNNLKFKQSNRITDLSFLDKM